MSDNEDLTFIEIGPHPVLNQPILKCCQELSLKNVPMILPSLHRDQSELETLLQTRDELNKKTLSKNYNRNEVESFLLQYLEEERILRHLSLAI